MSRQKIGEGLSGKVYYPALECEDSTKQPSGDYVSKVMKKDAAQKEYSKTESLRKLKPSGVVYPEHICDQKGNPTMSLLFSRYGGEELTRYYDAAQQKSSGKVLWWQQPASPDDIAEIPNIVKALETLRDEIAFLNSNGIYHNDVQTDNIVYDKKTKKAYLVDFEKMSSTPSQNDKEAIESILDDFKAVAA